MTCAICTKDGPCTYQPIGRNGQMVAVCRSCDAIHPRRGTYHFDSNEQHDRGRSPGSSRKGERKS